MGKGLKARLPPAEGARTGLLVAALLLAFVSGCAALIYEVLWVKQLTLVVGADVYATTVAISAFFAGLALGNYVFGQRADLSERPLFLYGCLEAGVACCGLASTVLLFPAARWFVLVEEKAGMIAWVLPFALVSLPAFFMGGTLPVLVRTLTPSMGRLAHFGGRLYATNTAGAIAGCMLASFFLIPTFGVRMSGLVAATLNLSAALIAFVLARIAKTRVIAIFATYGQRGQRDRLALVLYAAAGALALGYEVIWSHAIVQWTNTRAFAFAVVLAVYLTGLVLGSSCFSSAADRAVEPWAHFGLLISGAALCALLGVAVVGNWLGALQLKAATITFTLTHVEALAIEARFIVAAIFFVLLPTFLLGAAFPFALRLSARGSTPGRDSGAVIALNTAGGIAGTILTGFVLIPLLGVERSLGLLAICAAVIGLISVAQAKLVRQQLRWAVCVCAVAILATAVFLPSNHLANLLVASRGGRLLFHEPSAGGTVAIIEQPAGENRFRRLYIEGVSNSGDSLPSLRYMRLQALLPLIIHSGEPKSALVIGFGTGITAGSLLRYPNLERRVCAELLPAVVRGSAFFNGNYGAGRNRQLEVRLRDGRRELLRNRESYDVITLEPPPPSASGVVNLYSSDFYELAARRLNRNGLFAQWLPLSTQKNEETRSLVRSFLDAFPYVTLWTTELHEMLLVGSREPIELDLARINTRFIQPTVSTALQEIGINSSAALLSTYVTDRAGLQRYVGNTPPTTDDRPRIEYGAWVLPSDFGKTLSLMIEERSAPSLRNTDELFVTEMNAERDVLLNFYQAGLYALAHDQPSWQKIMAIILRRAPANPYYRWSVSVTAAKSAPSSEPVSGPTQNNRK